MTDVNINPQDVDPRDARSALNFLNVARTADEIANAIQIPGDRDVGNRVAQRILDRRDELGEFTQLQQIADIEQLGPARFTEIVTGLCKIRDVDLTSAKGVRVEFDPWGPDADTIAEISQSMLEHPLVQSYLEGSRHRMLSFELVDDAAKTRHPVPPTCYRSTIYDYTNNRTVVVDGRLEDGEPLEISEFGSQPLPSSEEFDDAVRILQQDPDVGAALRTEAPL